MYLCMYVIPGCSARVVLNPSRLLGPGGTTGPVSLRVASGSVPGLLRRAPAGPVGPPPASRIEVRGWLPVVGISVLEVLFFH